MSIKLSTKGIKYEETSNSAATASAVIAGFDEIQLNSSDIFKCPEAEARLITKSGINTLNPQAALRPIPINMAKAGGGWFVKDDCTMFAIGRTLMEYNTTSSAFDISYTGINNDISYINPLFNILLYTVFSNLTIGKIDKTSHALV